MCLCLRWNLLAVELSFSRCAQLYELPTQLLAHTTKLNYWYFSIILDLQDMKAEQEILLRFSLKEAVYKAIHPILCQFISFQEAEIVPHASGEASVRLFLASGRESLLHSVSATWRTVSLGSSAGQHNSNEDYFLCSAMASGVVEGK